MNRSDDLLKYLSTTDDPVAIIVTPNAPPVSRTSAGIRVALSLVLDPGDVFETLTALYAKAICSGLATLQQSGTFSFSLREVGRIRVSYITQRGSKAFSIVLVSSTIPEPLSICDNPLVVDPLLDMLCHPRAGILAVFGPSIISNSIFVYSLIQKANTLSRNVIYIMERSLTCLVSHAESIVIQAELGVDVPSLEEGIQNAFLFEPEVLYLGDIRPSDEVPSLVHAIDAGAFVIVNSSSMNGEGLVQKFRPQLRESANTGQFISAIARITPADGRKVVVELTSNSQ